MDPEIKSSHTREIDYLLICLIYLAIAVLLFLPEIGNIFTTVPGNNGDVYQNLWDLWWTKYALLIAHVGVYSYTKMLFYPVGFNLVFQTLSPISGLISIPFQYVSIEFAYNLLFFLGFVIGGFGAFLLIEYVVGNRLSAILGGLFFSFSAFHIAYSINHISWFFVGLTPLFLYFILRSEKEKSYVLPFLAGLAFVMILFMDGAEEALMAFIVAIAIIVLYLWKKIKNKSSLNRGPVVASGIFIATVLGVGSFGFIPVIQAALSGSGLSIAYSLNTISNNIAWSTDLVAFFVPNYNFYNAMGTSNLFYTSNDRTTYVGYILIALSAYGIYKTGLKNYGFWIALFVIFWLLSLGPYVKVNNTATSIPGIYLIYHIIPLANGIREPARFYLIASLAIALLASVGFRELLKARGFKELDNNYKLIFATCISVLFIFESFGIPISTNSNITTTPYAPEALINAAQQMPRNSSFLVLPSTYVPTYIYGGIADYYVTVLQRPLVGGYITRESSTDVLSEYDIPLVQTATYLATYNNKSFYTPPYSSPVYQNFTLQSLKTLEDYNVSLIIIQNSAYNNTALAELRGSFARIFGYPIYFDKNITLFSTANALNTNFYRDYLSYYNPSHWGYVFGNGAAGWIPVNNYGLIITYAPSIKQEYANTTINFLATAYMNQTILMDVCPCSMSQYVSRIPIPIYAGTHKYAVKTELATGSNWNAIEIYDNYTVSNNTAAVVMFNNITFMST